MFKPDSQMLKDLIRWGNNVAAARAGTDPRLREAARDAATDGLIRAMQKYEEGGGTAFDVYARQGMADAIRSRICREVGKLAREDSMVRLDAYAETENSES